MQKKHTSGHSVSNSLHRVSPAAWLTISYLILSVCWILLSDSAASSLAGSNEALLEKLQSGKGIFFVLLSGSFLYVLSSRFYKGIRISRLQKESIEKKFIALNETAGEGIFDYDIKTNKAVLNEQMKFFFPARDNEIENFWGTYQKRIHPDDLGRLITEYHEIIRTGKKVWKTEFRLLGSDIKYYNVIGNTYIIYNKYTREPLQLLGTVMDISELRNLQSEYYEQQLKHKRTLAASIIRAQENERNRWAEELHDNVCQILSVANMYNSDVCKNPGNAPTLAPEIKKLLVSSINEIRQLSASIKTHSFTTETLQQSLENLTTNINRVKSLDFELQTAGFDELKLCVEQKLMIYRIVQEQLNNIVKYAEATRVEIKLGIIDDEEVNISVKDNGKGFDPAKIKTGIGLRNIQSRLHVYNGIMQIDSAAGAGCTLQASFKLKTA